MVQDEFKAQALAAPEEVLVAYGGGAAETLVQCVISGEKLITRSRYNRWRLS